MQIRNKHLKNAARLMQRQVEQLLSLKQEYQARGKPYLTEKEGILSLNFDGLSVQSEMSIDAPDELVIGYTRAMMTFLLLEPSPAHIAMIGLGGGSLPKYCYRHLPRAEITVVEINPDVIALRNEFAVPPDDARFRVLLGDGVEWVRDTDCRPDVLIVDGFDAQGLPEPLGSQRFYDACFASLADDSIMVANLWGGYPEYEPCLARIHKSFADRVVVVATEESVNMIVLAVKGDKFPPSVATIRHHANLLCQHHHERMKFQAKANRLIRALSPLSA